MLTPKPDVVALLYDLRIQTSEAVASTCHRTPPVPPEVCAQIERIHGAVGRRLIDELGPENGERGITCRS